MRITFISMEIILSSFASIPSNIKGIFFCIATEGKIIFSPFRWKKIGKMSRHSSLWSRHKNWTFLFFSHGMQSAKIPFHDKSIPILFNFRNKISDLVNKITTRRLMNHKSGVTCMQGCCQINVCLYRVVFYTFLA
jgi:hypothetical protein